MVEDVRAHGAKKTRKMSSWSSFISTGTEAVYGCLMLCCTFVLTIDMFTACSGEFPCASCLWKNLTFQLQSPLCEISPFLSLLMERSKRGCFVFFFYTCFWHVQCCSCLLSLTKTNVRNLSPNLHIVSSVFFFAWLNVFFSYHHRPWCHCQQCRFLSENLLFSFMSIFDLEGKLAKCVSKGGGSFRRGQHRSPDHLLNWMTDDGVKTTTQLDDHACRPSFKWPCRRHSFNWLMIDWFFPFTYYWSTWHQTRTLCI